MSKSKPGRSYDLEDYDLEAPEYTVLCKWRDDPERQRRRGFLVKERNKYRRQRKPGSGNWTGSELDGTQGYGWQVVPEWRETGL